jgi:hypothetical protein
VLAVLEGRSSLLHEEFCELLRSHEVSSGVKCCLKFAVHSVSGVGQCTLMMSSTRSGVLSLTSGEVRAKMGRRLEVLSLTEARALWCKRCMCGVV